MAKRRSTSPEPPPPVGLGGRLRSVPAATWLFVALAVAMTILTVQGIATTGLADLVALGYVGFGGVPTAIAFLLPAALFLRHRDVWQTDRLLVVGTVLFGVVEVLQYITPGVSDWLASLIPAPPDVSFLAPLPITFGVVVGILGAMAPIYTGRGLVAARAYEDAPAARRWWVVVALLTLVAGVTNVLNLVNLSLDIPTGAVMAYFWLTVLTVAVSLLGVFGWAYLAGATLVGWRSGEEPARGWALASIGSGLVLVGLALSGIIASIGVFATPLPNQLSLGILGAFALAYLLLLAAFLARLPASIED